MLIEILIAVVVVVIVLAVVISLRPADFRYVRTAVIAAPPAAMFEQVNDFHKWEAWSPWAKIDPACQTSHEGATSGKGAVFKWSGNNKVGEGKMTVIESRPNDLIQIRLDFLRPFKATNIAEFTFQPQDNGTKVVWAMFGKNNFFAKAFGLFVDCDKLVGKDFERGLAQLKAQVESSRH